MSITHDTYVTVFTMDEAAGGNPDVAGRRDFIKSTTSVVMAGGMVAGYGLFAAHAGRYLYPPASGEPNWQFVATLEEMILGEALAYTTPAGAKVVIARQVEGDTESAFIALSSVCPHLGCQVHWESARDRFFCPCHNGVFDATGQATEGPPAKANQQLTRFPLKVIKGLLYIDVPMGTVHTRSGEATT